MQECDRCDNTERLVLSIVAGFGTGAKPWHADSTAYHPKPMDVDVLAGLSTQIRLYNVALTLRMHVAKNYSTRKPQTCYMSPRTFAAAYNVSKISSFRTNEVVGSRFTLRFAWCLKARQILQASGLQLQFTIRCSLRLRYATLSAIYACVTTLTQCDVCACQSLSAC